MTVPVAVEVFRHALLTAFWVSLPLLAIGFLTGVAVSLLQIVTSIQDTAFGAVPRLCAFLFGLLLVLPWMMLRLITYTTQLFGDFGRYAH